MAENRGKRAVIISNIKSQSIEQAIFILKTPTSARTQQPNSGKGIITEAQDIINSYIKSVEEPELAAKRKSSSRHITVISAIAAVCAAAVSLFLYFI